MRGRYQEPGKSGLEWQGHSSWGLGTGVKQMYQQKRLQVRLQKPEDRQMSGRKGDHSEMDYWKSSTGSNRSRKSSDTRNRKCHRGPWEAMKNQDKLTKKTKLSGLKNFFLVLVALPKHNE